MPVTEVVRRAAQRPSLDRRNDAVIRAEHLGKTYGKGEPTTPVFEDLSLSIAKGEAVAIVGPSGAGKSTLLRLLGGLDVPTVGEVYVTGQKMSALPDAARGILRNRVLGLVHQSHHLLPEFTALENVMLPVLLNGSWVQDASRRARSLIEAVGLGNRLQHKPGELSDGERQRVAVARAWVNRPECVLGEEPTGNLKDGSAAALFDLMLALNREHRTGLLLVTRARKLARRMDRVLELCDGTLRELRDEEI